MTSAEMVARGMHPPFAKGNTNGGPSRSVRKFRKALRDRFVPEAVNVLQEMLDASRDPDVGDDTRQRARMDFLKCCGLIPKHDEQALNELAAKIVDKMLAEAEARYARSIAG